jgi:hypothetical protein
MRAMRPSMLPYTLPEDFVMRDARSDVTFKIVQIPALEKAGCIAPSVSSMRF